MRIWSSFLLFQEILLLFPMLEVRLRRGKRVGQHACIRKQICLCVCSIPTYDVSMADPTLPSGGDADLNSHGAPSGTLICSAHPPSPLPPGCTQHPPTPRHIPDLHCERERFRGWNQKWSPDDKAGGVGGYHSALPVRCIRTELLDGCFVRTCSHCLAGFHGWCTHPCPTAHQTIPPHWTDPDAQLKRVQTDRRAAVAGPGPQPHRWAVRG